MALGGDRGRHLRRRRPQSSQALVFGADFNQTVLKKPMKNIGLQLSPHPFPKYLPPILEKDVRRRPRIYALIIRFVSIEHCTIPDCYTHLGASLGTFGRIHVAAPRFRRSSQLNQSEPSFCNKINYWRTAKYWVVRMASASSSKPQIGRIKGSRQPHIPKLLSDEDLSMLDE